MKEKVIPMVKLELKNIVKRFGNVEAVAGVSLSVEEGEFIVLLGPSGCGKTTILRLIAGFITLDEGTIFLNGKEVASKAQTVPPNLRDMSMVFQSYAVWPHMTVFENVAYGLKLRKLPKAEMQDRVAETLAMVKMDQYSGRYSHELSGGQQQRVALARALVVNPTILLLDEPLSNLDAKLRLEMRVEIKELQRRLKYTSIYVTHDQAEAMVLADRVILLENGKIRQQGEPTELYKFPKSDFAAKFFGTTNLIHGKIKSIESDSQTLVILSSFGKEVRIGRKSHLGQGCKIGDEVSISVRAQSMRVFENRPAGRVNTFEGVIEKVIYLGDIFDYEVKVAGGMSFRAEGDPDQRFDAGQRVYIGFTEEAAGVCCFRES
jgi:iron(III) transport system ATP-binding protein